MRRSIFAGALLLGAVLLFTPTDMAQAKEVPADGNIPLTSEYFPDEWFLNRMTWYDKDKDGILSPEEVAAVTSLECDKDLSDFSQVQYFTNLKKLVLEYEIDRGNDRYELCGIWVGEVLDLRAFPNLEHASLFLDTSKAPTGSEEVQIQVSGLRHLKELEIQDMISGEENNGDGSNAVLGGIDLRDTPMLETLRISDVKSVLFDEENQIKSLSIWNVKDVPFGQIAGFTELESLRIQDGSQDFTRLDISKNSALNELDVYSSSIKEIVFAGATALETAVVEGMELAAADVSHNPALKEIQLKCPKLERFLFDGADALEKVCIESDALLEWELPQNRSLKELEIKGKRFWGIDISKSYSLEDLTLDCPSMKILDVEKNTELKWLSVNSGLLKSLDISKNKKLLGLKIQSGLIKKLDLKRNKELAHLSLRCRKLNALDISANTEMKTLTIEKTPLKSLNLSKQKELMRLYIRNMKKLGRLDLSKNRLIQHLEVENTSITSLIVSKLSKLYGVKVTGNKKLTKLDLSGNKHVPYAKVSNNALKTLKIGIKTQMYHLNCSKNKLRTLDLSGAEALRELICDKKVKIKGYKGKVKRV